MMVSTETTAHVLQVITNMSKGMSNAILNHDLNTYHVCIDMLFHKISYRKSSY
jgi:hypothetical protein